MLCFVVKFIASLFSWSFLCCHCQLFSLIYFAFYELCLDHVTVHVNFMSIMNYEYFITYNYMLIVTWCHFRKSILIKGVYMFLKKLINSY